MKTIFKQFYKLLFLLPICLQAQDNPSPNYSLELFDGAVTLEYDEVRLIKEGTYKSTYYEEEGELVKYEEYMVFHVFKGEEAILEIEVLADEGYTISEYFFIDEDFDMKMAELSDDNEDYFIKLCKDILVTSPVLQNKTLFDWRRRLNIQELKTVNTIYDEYRPTLSADGKRLFFLKSGAPDNSMTFTHERINNGKPLKFDELDEVFLATLKPEERASSSVLKKSLEAQQEKHLEFILAARKASKKENADRAEETENLNSSFDSDIWVADLKGGRVTTITHQDYPLNDWAPNFFVGISADGKKIYTEYKKLGKGYSGIEGDLYSFMEFSQKGRTAQFNFNGALLRFEKMHNVFAVSYFMTLNNNAILCSFKGDDTKGGSDIYISFKQANGKFEYPINIGGVVNSDLEETNPFLAADLETLYFSRRVNAKEQKIFMSRRLDDSWENWSEPIALPNPINLPMTENTDAFVTADGKTLYFVSNRKRGKDRDIYFVQLDDILSPTGAPLVKGKVVHNGRALENAVVEVQKVGVKTKQKDVSYAVSKKDGAYETPFKAEEDVAITATQKGYISEVILPKEARKNAQNIEMTKLDRGNRFVLKSIFV